MLNGRPNIFNFAKTRMNGKKSILGNVTQVLSYTTTTAAKGLAVDATEYGTTIIKCENVLRSDEVLEHECFVVPQPGATILQFLVLPRT